VTKERREIWKEEVVAYVEVHFRHLPEGAEENKAKSDKVICLWTNV
jgi:hypothetical protein